MPIWNLALDSAFLKYLNAGGCKNVFFRLYEWEPPAISLGYHQRVEDGVNLRECQRYGIPVVRRPTGGKTVFHHKELTYMIAAPLSVPPFGLSISEVYRALTGALTRALISLGIPVQGGGEKNETGPGAGTPSCFSSICMNEIVLDGRKLVGSAQIRKERAILQHGSILLDRDLDLWRKLIPGEEFSADEGSISLRERGYEITRKGLYQAIIAALSELTGLPCIKASPDREILEMAKTLMKDRERDTFWSPGP